MEEQTKIGTGAAAVIALMSILEPHLFDTHPVFAALIYIGLGSAALWGFAPLAIRLTRMLFRRGYKRMWPQYLMMVCGIGFFVGLVGFLQISVETPSRKAEAPLETGDLCRRTTDLASQIRTFAFRWDQIISDQSSSQMQRLHYQRTEEEARLWMEVTKALEKTYTDRNIEFVNRYRPKAIALRDELLFQIKMLGMTPPEPNGSAKSALDGAQLGGPHPEVSVADYLESLCRLLPSTQKSEAPNSNIPVSIKREAGINAYTWQGRSQLPGPDPMEGGLIKIGPLYVTNLSSKRPLTLDITLGLIDQEGGPEWPYSGSGENWRGQKVGRDDLEAEIAKKQNLALTRYLLSPLTLQPLETAHGTLAFLLSGQGNHDVKWKVFIRFTDVATGHTVRIPASGDYFGAAD
jgi:hypothetical protein